MNIHKNARLTLKRRIDLVRSIVERKTSLTAAAIESGVSVPTARKWLARYLAALNISKSTVGRVLARAGLSHLADLMPQEPIVRYEHERPGDLLHLDTKKLGRIHRPGKRIPGSPYRSIGAGWETLFVAVDDHSRVGFTDLYPDETKGHATQFLENAVTYYKSLGVRIRRVLTDNGPAFHSKVFAETCSRLRSGTSSPGPTGRRPTARPNGSSSQPCASGPTPPPITHSSERAELLDDGFTTTTGTGRTKASDGVAPISRLPSSRNNLLTLHS